MKVLYTISIAILTLIGTSYIFNYVSPWLAIITFLTVLIIYIKFFKQVNKFLDEEF